MNSVPRKLTLGLIVALGAAACGDDVTVSEQPAPTPVVRSVIVSPSAANIAVGGTSTFGSAVDADAGLQTTVTWTSSNGSVATVNNQGTATGVASGTTSICATSTQDTNKSSCAQLTVAAAGVTRAVVVSPAASTINVGATFAFGVSVDADAGIPSTVTWSSSTPAVATVNASGVATGVSAGTTSICATSTADANKSGCSQLTVQVAAPSAIVVSPSAVEVEVGTTQAFLAQVTAGAGIPTTVTWSSSNTSVATVSSAGVATAVAAGTTAICATSTADASKNNCAAMTVVNPPVIPPATVEIDAITIGCDAIAMTLAPGVACNLNSPVASNNVFGEFQVQTNVNRPVGSNVTGVRLQVLNAGDNSVEWEATQTLSADAMATVEGLSAQVSSNRVTFTVQSAAYTINGAGTAATPRHLNGQKKIRVSLLGGVGGTATSADRDLTFRNANGFHITQTVDLSGNNPNGVAARRLDAAGLQWTGGTNLTFRSLPVAYTGAINPASHVVTFGGGCGNTARTRTVSGVDAAFPYTSGAAATLTAGASDVNGYGIQAGCGAAYTVGETPSANGVMAGTGNPFINIALGGNFGATNTLNNAQTPVEPTEDVAPAIRLDNLGPVAPTVTNTPNGRTGGWMNSEVALAAISPANANGTITTASTDAGYNAAGVPATGAPGISYTAYVCASGTTAAVCAGAIPGNLSATAAAGPANGVPRTSLAGFPETLTPTSNVLVHQAVDAFRNRTITSNSSIGVDLTQPIMIDLGSTADQTIVNTGALSLNVGVYDALSGFNTSGDLLVSGVRVTAGVGTQTRALMTGFGTGAINTTPFATAANTAPTSAHLVATPATPAYTQIATQINMNSALSVTASVPGYFVVKAQGRDRAGNRSDFFTRAFYRNQNEIPLITGLNSALTYTGGVVAQFPASAQDATEIVQGELRLSYPNTGGQIIYSRPTPVVSQMWDDAGISNPAAVDFAVPFFLHSVRQVNGSGAVVSDDATQKPTTVHGRVYNPFGTNEFHQQPPNPALSGVGANGRSADFSAPILGTQVSTAAANIWAPGGGQNIADFTLALSSCSTAGGIETCTWVAEVRGPTGSFTNPFTYGIGLLEAQGATTNWRLINATQPMGEITDLTNLTTTITPLFSAPFPTLDNGNATNGRVFQWQITTARPTGLGLFTYRVMGVKTTGAALVSTAQNNTY